MKFTKTELTILSPKYERWNKIQLWLGIICICFSIAMIPYMMNKNSKLKDNWDAAYVRVDQGFEPETKQEAKLKTMLLEATEERKDLWLAYLEELAHKSVFFFFVPGVFLIAGYVSSRIYINLIRKLKNSQQENRGVRE